MMRFLALDRLLAPRLSDSQRAEVSKILSYRGFPSDSKIRSYGQSLPRFLKVSQRFYDPTMKASINGVKLAYRPGDQLFEVHVRSATSKDWRRGFALFKSGHLDIHALPYYRGLWPRLG